MSKIIKKYVSDYVANDTFTLKDAEDLVIKVKTIEGRTDRTIKAYKSTFRDMEKFFDFDVDVNTFTSEDARDYIYWQLHEKQPYSTSNRPDLKGVRGVSAKTANNYRILGGSIFNILEEEGRATNIFKGIKKIKEDEKPLETLTIEEVRELFDAFNKKLYTEFRNYVASHLMFDAFSRIGETLKIKESDINFKSKTISFNKTKGRRFRIVNVSDKTLRLLQELIKENEVFDTDYVFLTIAGENVSIDTVRKNFYLVANRTSITKNVYPHILRHTASAMYLANGGNIRILQMILGHASISTTEIYAHVLDGTIKDQLEQFSPIHQLERKSKTRTSRKRRS